MAAKSINIPLTALIPVFILLFSFAVTANAGMRAVNKIRAGTPPFRVLEEIMQSNLEAAGQADRNPSQTGSPPLFTWLTDADAAIQPGLVAVNHPRVYTIRNLGNQLELDTGAIDYGVRHLHTPLLLITGNTDCQAIRFFLEGYDDLEPDIRGALDHLRPALGEKAESGDEAKGKISERLVENVLLNVDYQVGRAIERYRDRIKSGRLVVVGSVLDLRNAFGLGVNRLIIINVNGEKDGSRLKRLPIMTRLNKELLPMVGRQESGDRKQRTEEKQ